MRVFLAIIMIVLFSCTSKESKKVPVSTTDTIGTIKDGVETGVVTNDTSTIKTELKNQQPEKLEKKIQSKDNIEVRVFKNENDNGYGYDILMNGKVTIHQPNVPAVSGNSGFKSEDLARRVGELAASKIRMDIMPPTISTIELDSLGVK